VRRLAVERDEQFLDGDAVHGDEVGIGGVHHHRSVDVVEGPLARHQHLAAAALLGGRAHDPHAAARSFGHERSGQPGAQPGGGDDVVPARVAHPGQRVVLAEHGDAGAGRAGRCVEGGLHLVGVAGGGDVVLLQQTGEQVVCELLLKLSSGWAWIWWLASMS
jgi:hypothetical protein